MKLPAYGEVLTPRAEVIDPRKLLDMVDIGLVSGGRQKGLGARAPGAKTTRDPDEFFAITYPTSEIVETLRVLAKRASEPQAVPGTILLSGRYGQGKSHVLLAAHHALSAPDALAIWAKRWGVSAVGLPKEPLVITRSFIQHAEEPLWEMLVKRLAPNRRRKIGDFVDGEQVESLLGDRQVFVIMDELERWYDAQDDLSKSRSRNFLQALSEVSMRDGRLTLITSVLGEKQEPAETIRRVGPAELSFRSAEDRQRVALFRLFENRDSAEAAEAAAAATDAYVAKWQEAGIENIDALPARMRETWPFTPEFLDVLTKKIPNLGGFQNTRGALRFLAHVVRHTKDHRPVVSSQDLPFGEDAVHQALSNLDTSGGEVVRRALGDNYDAVREDMPHRDELFSALIYYSIADPTKPGATMDELLLATLDPGENPIRIRDALSQLQKQAFNLHHRDERYVFLATENPHARINAIADSPRVTVDAMREHLEAALVRLWGNTDRTALVRPWEDDESVRRGLGSLKSGRVRVLLSAMVLSEEKRLRLQNLSEERNLIILVEPRVHTSTDASAYSIFSDDDLVHHARRIEATTLLLEGKPGAEAGAVYSKVQGESLKRLHDALARNYGVAISWHRAAATGTPIDDDWYDVCRLDRCTFDGLLEMWRTDLSGQPEVEHEIRERWADFRNRPVSDLVQWFTKTPGLPVPLEHQWFATALRNLTASGVLSLVDEHGTVMSAAAIEACGIDALRGCTIVDARTAAPDPEPDSEVALVHRRVSAQHDPASGGIVLSWEYPPEAREVGKCATLVQRYKSARSWTIGSIIPMDPSQTHDANRYHGPDQGCVDDENLHPGDWYLYYVFLVLTDSQGTVTYRLSQRCDVGVPAIDAQRPGELATGHCRDVAKLTVAAEKLVMSPKNMTSDSRVRKISISIHGVSQPEVQAQFGGELSSRPDMESSANINFVARGSYSRQDVLAFIRLVPKYEGASYSASLALEAPTGERDQG